METARLMLDYIKILIWPAVVLIGLLLFRQQLRDIASRVTRASVLGMEIEAAVRGAQAAVEDAVEANTEDEDVEPDDPVGAWLEPDARRSNDPATDEAFQAINKLEQSIRSFGYLVDESLAGRTTKNTTHSLIQRGLLQPSMQNSVAELLHVRDNVAGALNPQDAKRITDAGLTQLLVVQLARHAFQDPRRRVVGDQ
jgi:type II secretory pathway pseudopilin PulG